MNGLVVTVLVNGSQRPDVAVRPALHRRLAVRPQPGPRRRRLEQLARHLRQLHRPGAAAAVDVREHRGLHRRRRRPLHRRPHRHVDGQRAGRYAGTPAAGGAATSLMSLPVRTARRHRGRRRRRTSRSPPAAPAASSSTTTARATSSTSRSTWRPAGRHRRPLHQEPVGRPTRPSPPTLAAGVDYKLAVTLNGTAVTVSLNGVAARLVLVLRRGRRRRHRDDQPDRHHVVRQRARRRSARTSTPRPTARRRR